MQYKDYADIFSKDMADTVAPHRPIDHTIHLESGFNMQYGRIYNFLEVEFKILEANIETNLANEFIQQSSLSAAAPILFAKKMDARLRLCVDYQTLNNATVLN
jgi:hypothetical protein